MNLARTLRFFLALALLAAWQTALVHPLQHVDENGAYVHVAGVKLSKKTGDRSGSNPLCDAIAAVTACLGASAGLCLAAVERFSPVSSRVDSVALRAPSTAYRSQAPPSLV